MKRVFRQAGLRTGVQIIREHGHEVVERSEDATILRPGVGESAHLALFFFDEIGIDPERQKDFAERHRQTERERLCFLGGDDNGEQGALAHAQQELLRPRKEEIDVPVAEKSRRSRRIRGKRQPAQQLLRTPKRHHSQRFLNAVIDLAPGVQRCAASDHARKQASLS